MAFCGLILTDHHKLAESVVCVHLGYGPGGFYQNMNKIIASNFISIAQAVANSTDYTSSSRHVSLVVCGKSIISVGTNHDKTHTLAKSMGYNNNYVHSELDAYSKIRYRDGNFILLNFRFNRKGDLRNSKPCKFCLPWCIEIFDEIWFSTNTGMKKYE